VPVRISAIANMIVMTAANLRVVDLRFIVIAPFICGIVNGMILCALVYIR